MSLAPLPPHAPDPDVQELDRLLAVPGNRQFYGGDGGSLIRNWFFEEDAVYEPVPDDSKEEKKNE